MTETCVGAASTTARGLRIRRLYGVASILIAALAAAAIAAPAGASPAFTTLYTFPNSAQGQMFIDEGVIANGGVLYGVTREGGKTTCTNGCGTVFSLAPTANPNVWLKTSIYHFNGGSLGFEPHGQLLAGPGGVLYGATY